MNCSLRILKTLHLVRVRWSSVVLQWYNASRIGASSVRSSDHRQLYVNYLIKVSKVLNRMTECNNNKMCIKKCNCYDKVPKYCNPLAFHCQDLISSILCCLFWAINVMWINVEYVWVCQFSERVRRALISPKTGRKNGRIERNNCNACWVTQCVLSVWYTNIACQLHLWVNVSLLINSVD